MCINIFWVYINISNEWRVAREPSSPISVALELATDGSMRWCHYCSKCLDMSYTPYKPWIVDEKYTYLQHNHPPIVGWLPGRGQWCQLLLAKGPLGHKSRCAGAGACEWCWAQELFLVAWMMVAVSPVVILDEQSKNSRLFRVYGGSRRPSSMGNFKMTRSGSL